ncbi:glycosyltransferase family 4 protein [Chromobacterium paludis]|uniref:Glycosyltransferase n=1 Tax=Chromobacterium paludis TaxID=2605945 RepID=A0A5C1DNW2_9NEIS|nr:glycosyltransferase [Chromobacterium paludis]QEL57709.1 glycosyltransferase [Chromobacterium paludis]
MRVAFILPSNAKAAPNVVASLLIKQLVKSNIVVDLFVFKFSEVDRELPFEIKPVLLNFKFEFSNYDIVHSMGFKPDLFVFMNKMLGKIGSCKIVTTIHSDVKKDLIDLYGFCRGFFFSTLWRCASCKFDARIFLNNIQMSNFGFHSKYLINRVIPNAVELSDYKFSWQVKMKNIVLYCGALRDIKGVDIALNSVRFSNLFNLDVVGDGSKRSVRRYHDIVKQNDIEGRVRFLGHSSDVNTLLSKYKIIIVPSRSEGFGLIILEAIYSGLYVICNDIPELRSLFNNFPVFFYKENDAKSLALVIEKILDLPDIRSVDNFFKEKFAPDIMGRAYINVYKELAAE